jgi:hypothetical protein
MRLAYDDRAMYLGACCYEEDPAKIRARVTRRQDPDLWTDDSLEIYISLSNVGPSCMKFTLNSLGTQMDLRMDEENQPHTDWLPEDQKKWRVAAQQTREGWVAEVEIPWTDLGRVPQAGEVWTFAAIRFSWVTGSYVADKTSPGARHGHKQGFGYVAFGVGISSVFQRVQAAVQGRENAVSWELDLPEGAVCRFQSYPSALSQSLQEIKVLSNECQALIGWPREGARLEEYRLLNKETQEVEKRVRSFSEPGSAEWHSLGSLLTDLKARLVELRRRFAVGLVIED